MNHRGFVFVAALSTLTLLTGLSLGMLIRGATDARVSERRVLQHAAFQLAEAGLDRAAKNLEIAGTDDDLTTEALLTGTYTVTVNPDAPGALLERVTSLGIASTEQRNLEGVFQLTPESVFQFALFGDDVMTVGGNVITDSYDSRDGPYQDDPNAPGYNADHHGDIGTNATTLGGVAVSGSVFIDGQVAVGPGVEDPTSVVSGYDPNYITGDPKVLAQTELFALPAVEVPAALSCEDETISAQTTVTLQPGTHCYHDLTIQGGGALTASGEVTVYLTGQLIARGNSTVGVVDDPTQMQFLIASSGEATLEEGTLTGSTTFYGAVYGPQADIRISGNAEIFGAVIARSVNLSGSAEVHYDAALADDDGPSNRFRTSLISWRELP